MIKKMVVEIAQKNNFPYKVTDSDDIYLDVIGKTGTWISFSKVLEDENLFNFYSVLNSSVPENKRDKILKLITKINFGLKTSSFEFNEITGELRLKNSISFPENKANEDFIERAIFLNITCMDNYFEEIMREIYS
ncbi:MAG: YbjN domain-containing protein [Peptostreptococcaceae bacterium]|jgi:hypothetical protein|nr:YbjN domain-containing protein [Peptostreptococcaceae bacterium]